MHRHSHNIMVHETLLRVYMNSRVQGGAAAYLDSALFSGGKSNE